jgi:hypothetical protein
LNITKKELLTCGAFIIFSHHSDDMESTTNCNPVNCPLHFHLNDTIFVDEDNPQKFAALLEENRAIDSERQTLESTVNSQKRGIEEGQQSNIDQDKVRGHGFKRIIRNFTPS